MNGYLWDKSSGTPDPFIVRLEHVLARRRYRPRRVWAMKAVLALPLGLLAAGLVVAAALGPGSAEISEPEPVRPLALEQQADRVVPSDERPAAAEEGALTDAFDPLAVPATR